MKLEVVLIPVADVDRAKAFYEKLGWRLDADFSNGGGTRGVQFTPPGSAASIQFGTGDRAAKSGPGMELFLVVSDLEAARADIVRRGVSVTEIFHRTSPLGERLPGPHPERKSYSSFAAFRDPDGNGWLLQEIRQRLPGR